MVAVLTRLFGFQNIEQAEDIVHDTILKALETWKFGKIPNNPQAWLYFTAKNKAIDVLRRQKIRSKAEHSLSVLLESEYTLVPAVNEMFTDDEIKDNQLRMMFACCHPSINYEAQVTLMLKTLCGLSTHEIANAFLTSDDTIQKRLHRTKEKIRLENITLDYPGAEAMPARTGAVLKALYLLFNEGYNSSHPVQLIREDLCEEAMRLTILITENPKTAVSQAYALLALMCYHVSRFDTRTDEKGFIVLLKDQDRTKWSQFFIQKGNDYLEQATGEVLHDYHLEAAIASIHANAPTYNETDWKAILSLYDLLYERSKNPVVGMNRCLVIAEVAGPVSAINELEKMYGLEYNAHYYSSLGELNLRIGATDKAKTLFNKALAICTSATETELIKRKLSQCD
jgi:RNA polymerase sigma-70 factor (ECF subfamily)